MTEQEYKTDVYEKAKAVQDWAGLVKLLKEIYDDKHGDYGKIVYGCAAAMKAAFNYVNRGPNGGITGFQASCLGWELIHEFMSVKAPCRLLDYNNMLYPQYADKFDKTITSGTWEDLKKKAEENLAASMNKSVHPNVIAHWKTIVAGEIPFGYRIEAE